MQLRTTVQNTIVFEIIIITLMMLIGFFVKSAGGLHWTLAAWVFIHLVLFSTPLAFSKGFDFIIYDAPPDSLWKYYGFLVIFLSAFFSSIIDEYFSHFVLSFLAQK